MNKAKKNTLNKLRPDYNALKHVTNTERIAAIGHTDEAIGWRPMPYKIPDSFLQFLDNLDTDLEDFISKSNPDRYNAEYYLEVIEEACNCALKELPEQKIEHIRSIHNIEIYQQACLKDRELDLQRMEEALAKKKEVA